MASWIDRERLKVVCPDCMRPHTMTFDESNFGYLNDDRLDTFELIDGGLKSGALLVHPNFICPVARCNGEAPLRVPARPERVCDDGELC